jgi:oligopeptidase B
VTDTGIADVSTAMVFSADSQHLFYIRLEQDSLRSFQLWRHQLGTARSEDRLVYEETDRTFELRIRKTKSSRYILLHSVHQQSTEIRYLAADRPHDSFQLMEPRRHGHVYDADHSGGRFYIRTNSAAPDFRVATAPEASPEAAYWQDFIAQTPGRVISRLEAFDDFVALVEQHDALQSVRVLRLTDRQEIAIPRPAEIGVMDISSWQNVTNRNPAASVLHVRFDGSLHPPSLYDVDTRAGTVTLRWRSPAARWFDAETYAIHRITAAAPDGERVPVTLIYRRDKFRRGENPALIVGYGAYGFSMLPRFHGDWISLVDRGFVYALAHVRGGKENGQRWYDEGRVLNKRNTFTDFIAVTETLTAQGFAHPRRVFAKGGSAGGLLMGALANQRPDLFAGLVAEVPFVDVISTASDPSLPTATLEYEEWGDPGIREHYFYMLSYSPYDNVRPQHYPPLLVTTARYDSQVGFHEPAKWVARLRAKKTDSNELLLLTNMIAGHSGVAGRFGTVQEDAQIMAWLIAQATRD